MEFIAVYIISILFLTSLIVFFLIARFAFRKEIGHLNFEILKSNRTELLPLKLKAIERLTLFLERISPESMILREQSNCSLNMNLQSNLLSIIRQEFEYNQAMQVYVTTETWERVRLAKEEVIRVINICASEVQPKNPSIELAKNVIERFPFSGASHIERALNSLRNEVTRLTQI